MTDEGPVRDGPGAEGGSPSPPREGEALEALRRKVLEVDEALVSLIGERTSLVRRIGEMKRELGLPVMDPGREAAVVRRAVGLAREMGVDEEMTRDVIWRIMAAAREEQEG